MPAGRYNICINQGSTFQRDLTYTDSDGAAIDLSGATVRLQARVRVNAASPVIDISSDTSGITITDAAAGEFQILLSATTTAAYTFTSAVYDLEIEFSDGEVRKILDGIVDVRPEVTR